MLELVTALVVAFGVVFVADSQKAMGRDNTTAFENMKVNLLANRLVPEKVPLVLQYNKRDLPNAMSVEELNDLLCGTDVYLQPGTQSVTMQNSLCARCAVVIDDVPSHRIHHEGIGRACRTGDLVRIG